MKKEKTWFVLFLCIVLVASIISGCASQNISTSGTSSQSASQVTSAVKDPIHLKFWAWDDTNKGRTNSIEQWNASHDSIKVDMEIVPWTNYHDKLLTSISAGGGPDVPLMSVQWLPEFVGMNALLQLDEYVAKWKGKDDIYESIWTATKAGYDKLYALPYTMVTYYLYCRKDLFDKAGIPLPATIDEFYEACKKLTMDTNGDGKTDVYGFGMRGARMGHQMWAGVTFADGAQNVRLFDEAGNVTLNVPQLVAASKRYIDLYKNGYTPKTAPADGANEIQQNFLSGATAMLVHHVASSKAIKEKWGDNVVPVAIPKGSGGRLVPMELTVVSTLTATKYKDESIEFIEWLDSPGAHDLMCRAVGQVPFLKSVAAFQFYKDDIFQKVSIESIPDAYLFTATPEMGQWTEMTWPAEFQKALVGKSTPEEFIKNITDALKPIKK